MLISRRKLLQHMTTGAAATATAPFLTEISLGAVRGSVRLPEGADNAARSIRLNRNENAYGPSANVTAAMKEAALNAGGHYPEVELAALRSKIAEFHGVAPGQIVLGCGSGEIMRMAVDAFVGPRQKLVAAVPAYDLILDFARRAGAEVVR